MELVGTVEDFIFQNDQNGYSIAVFETEDGVITTVVGYLPFVESGDYLKLVGKEVVHLGYRVAGGTEVLAACLLVRTARRTVHLAVRLFLRLDSLGLLLRLHLAPQFALGLALLEAYQANAIVVLTE